MEEGLVATVREKEVREAIAWKEKKKNEKRKEEANVPTHAAPEEYNEVVDDVDSDGDVAVFATRDALESFIIDDSFGDNR
ncbi:hypothetical protein E2542_SST20712 [Spatholobus suberectus]|nr:hypothetical protein E2542_SST20712 [Spatholobus suberectus]